MARSVFVFVDIVNVVPMRQECKHYESRSYPTGDTVRKCNIDLAPDAPWRCPQDCPGYQRRLVGGDWAHGSLVPDNAPPEPAGLDDGSAAAVLDAAEEILNAVGPGILADFEPAPERRSWLPRLFGRRRRRNADG